MPTVVDEAADTPAWVPALGLGLFALFAMVIAGRMAWQTAHPEPTVAADAAAAPEAPEAAAAK